MRTSFVMSLHRGKKSKIIMDLRAINRDSARIFDLLDLDWPVVDNFIGSLEEHISISISEGRYSLLSEMIEESLKQYEFCLIHMRSKSDHYRMGVFIESLLSQLCDTRSFQVVHEDGDSWSIDSSESFTDWQSRYRGRVRVERYELPNPASSRENIYQHMLKKNGRLQFFLRGLGYEDSILANTLSIYH